MPLHPKHRCSMSKNKVETFIPKRRSNLNHLGTIHAIAQATAGELSAGMCLLVNFGMDTGAWFFGKNFKVSCFMNKGSWEEMSSRFYTDRVTVAATEHRGCSHEAENHP